MTAQARTGHDPLDPVDGRWRDAFIRTAEARSAGERRQLATMARKGTLDRVRVGAYRIGSRRVESRAAAHLALVRAFDLRLPGRHVFVARSAAAVWGVPRLDPWPERVEVHVADPTGGRSTPRIRRIFGSPPEEDELGGIRVSALARTALDVARQDGLASGLVALDAVLAGLTVGGSVVRISREQLAAELEAAGRGWGVATAREGLDLADGRSESPGESLSRLQIVRAGLSAPVLQHEFRDEVGVMRVDFYWPDYGVIGEFDGAVKYLGDGSSAGRAAAEVVYREKRREDRLRRLGPRVVRWDMATARSRPRLAALLRGAGVR